MNDLLERFKKIYEEGTSHKVSWSKIDKNKNLTVGIVNAEVYWF